MPFAPDSRTAGYLGPAASPQPPVDDAWEDFLHDLIAGITGMDPTLVRPRWQPEPPNQPAYDVDWVGFGVTQTLVDFTPAVIHSPTGDAVRDHQVDTVRCTFYGPHAEQYASYLRRGLYVDQNRAVLRANAAGLVEVTDPMRMPEQVKANQWLQRVDLEIHIRREIHYDYAVLDLLQSVGTITAQPPPPDETRLIEADFDTNAHQGD